MVSVSCTAYNHEKYIRKCLESFVMQKTSFPFEVIVHDDASTDGTAAIIREFEEKYPDMIKPIYQTENQYSKDISIYDNFIHPKARGKYIAFCEGDDAWSDEYKLQKQFDAMEAHPEVDMCAHAVKMLNAVTEKMIKMIAPRDEDCIIPVEDVIRGGGGFVGTNSLFYRREIRDNVPAFRQIYDYDYTLQILGALRGGMLYLAEDMSVYNYLTSGSWSRKLGASSEMKNRVHNLKMQMFDALDLQTEGKYHDTIELTRTTDCLYKLSSEHKRFKIFAAEYRPAYKAMSKGSAIKLVINTWFPRLSAFITRHFRRGGRR